MAITGQLETTRTRDYAYSTYDGSWYLESRTEVSWYVGAKFGGEFAIGAFVGALAIAGITGD